MTESELGNRLSAIERKLSETNIQVIKQVGELDRNLNRMIGRAEGFLPLIATKEDLNRGIEKHIDFCTKNLLNRSSSKKTAGIAAGIVSLLGVVAATVYTYVKNDGSFFSLK